MLQIRHGGTRAKGKKIDTCKETNSIKTKTMCFETTKTAKAKIAKTDIECWKVINKDGTNGLCHKGYIPRITYEINKICAKVQIKKEANPSIYSMSDYAINEGYHSYKTKKLAINEVRTGLDVIKGRYCYRKFIIPTGTRYFENETEYVSETIMLID